VWVMWSLIPVKKVVKMDEYLQWCFIFSIILVHSELISRYSNRWFSMSWFGREDIMIVRHWEMNLLSVFSIKIFEMNMGFYFYILYIMPLFLLALFLRMLTILSYLLIILEDLFLCFVYFTLCILFIIIKILILRYIISLKYSNIIRKIYSYIISV
jgi:hypothetical protein